MPKAVLQLNPFHGGLNSNADPRDLKDIEFASATDISIDNIGVVKTLGSNSSSNMPSTKAATISAGHGLFHFKHDRVGAENTGTSAQAETGDNYLALANADAGADIEIYRNGNTTWSSASRIVLGDGSSTTGLSASYYIADGNLRVGDANFGSDKRVKWFGYVDRYFYGDGSSGRDTGELDNGILVDRWVSANANLEPLSLKSVGGFHSSTTHQGFNEPTASDPVVVGLKFDSVTNQSVVNFANPNASSDAIAVRVNLASDETITASPSISSGSESLNNFASVGDVILIKQAADSDNNSTFTIKSATSTVLTVEEDLAFDTNDTISIFNLSKSSFFNKDNPNLEIAISTLYDESKQESPLHIQTSGALTPNDLIGSSYVSGFQKLQFQFCLYTGISSGGNSEDGAHLNYPRISGFKIYMRNENTSDWYLQAIVDISKGITLAGEEDYNMWSNDELSSGGTWTTGAEAVCTSNYTEIFRKIETYESETGLQSSNLNIGFNANGLGFKTAVVTNRRAYVGNVTIKDKNNIVRTLPDAILKSGVNNFDSFSFENRIEATVNDGSSIVKLEEFADRLLEFKENKMTLINISQSVEFLEDVYEHKGIKHQSSVAKTDYGVSWANDNGCFLFDGKQVINLLEKDGLQIIKESDWQSFIGDIPMVGYVPKKRQIIVLGEASSSGNGDIYLYDIVTKSWVRGDSKYANSVNKTNFITDWNGDLVYAYQNSGNAVFNKWQEDSADTSNFSLKTKDVDFGYPAVRKKLYRIRISYKGDANSLVVKYSVNGDTDTLYQFEGLSSDVPTGSGSNTPLEDKSSDLTKWHHAELIPSTSSEASNIYSCQLHMDGTCGGTFEINDISFVYRLKNIK